MKIGMITVQPSGFYKFPYKGVQRVVKVEHVNEGCRTFTGFDYTRLGYRQYDIRRIREFELAEAR